MRYFIVAALLCAGCSGSELRQLDAAFADYEPHQEPIVVRDNWPVYQPQSETVWCRSDGAGGMYCSGI